MTGMTRASRGPASLRLRAAAVGKTESAGPVGVSLAGGLGAPAALVGGLNDVRLGAQRGATGLLGTLGLSDGDLNEPGARAAAPVPPLREGIQERLPPMPGMRRQSTGRRATGEPRLRAQGSIAEALRSCPPPTPPQGDAPTAAGLAALAPSDAPAAARQPIQERVPRFAVPVPPGPLEQEAPPSPPTSPPEILPKGKAPPPVPPVKSGTTSLVARSDKAVSAAAHGTRLQTNARVLPNGADEEDTGPESWDDRSVRLILWGIAREHTVLGFMTAFLLGSEKKLASVPQVVQLLCGAMIGMLFLSCAQLRYTWLGATWVFAPPYEQGVTDNLMDRMPFLSTVGIAAAAISWSCVLITRWLFLMANRMYPQSTREQAILMYGTAWGVVVIVMAALAIGAVDMASNMDAPVVKMDVMVGWALACAVQWLLYEPAGLMVFACVSLLLKWCTSFEDLPEVKAEMVKQQKEQFLLRKAELAKQQDGSVTQQGPLALEGPTSTKVPKKAP